MAGAVLTTKVTANCDTRTFWRSHCEDGQASSHAREELEGKSVAHGNGLGKPEGKTPLRRESHILRARRVGRTGTARSTESCTDESAFSAASQAADESACGRAATDHFQIAL